MINSKSSGLPVKYSAFHMNKHTLSMAANRARAHRHSQLTPSSASLNESKISHLRDLYINLAFCVAFDFIVRLENDLFFKARSSLHPLTPPERILPEFRGLLLSFLKFSVPVACLYIYHWGSSSMTLQQLRHSQTCSLGG